MADFGYFPLLKTSVRAGLGSKTLISIGSSAAPYTIKTADAVTKKYTKSTVASGDSRNTYLRHYISGGGSGEALRAFTTVDTAAAGGGVHGGHLSLSFGASPAAVTGLGVAARATLHIPNRALAAGGTYAAALAEIYLDGTSADPAAVTEYSVLKVQVDGGDATSQAKVKNAMHFAQTLGADASGNMIYSHDHAAGNAAGSIRILVNGAVKYLKFWAAE